MNEEKSSTWVTIKESAIGWGIPTLFSAIPFIAWYNVCADFLRALGWRFVTAVFSVLMFACVRTFYLWLAERSKRKEVESELENDYRRYLEPVPGKGVYRDRRNGEVVCPRCVAEKNVPTPMYEIEPGLTYACGACGCMVPK